MTDTNPRTYKSFHRLNFMALNCMLGNVFFGYMLGVYNPLQKYIKTEYGWSSSEDSLYSGILTALIPIGALIGCLVAGPLSNKILVKKTLILSDLMAFVGVGITLINTYSSFCVGRFINGLAVGLNSTLVPVYLSEISPKEIAGLLTSYTQIGVNIGILISDIWGLGVPEAGSTDLPNYWRLVFGFPILTCAIRILTLLFIFKEELPLYYLKDGKPEQALKVINDIYKPEYADLVFNELQEKFGKQTDMPYSQFFGKKYGKRTWLSLSLMLWQQLCGINAVIFYSASIFENNGYSEQMSKIFVLIIGLTLVISVFVGSPLYQRLGRRTLLLFGNLMCFFTLLALGIFNKFELFVPAVIFIILFIFFFSISLGPVVWMAIADIVPAKGMGLAVVVNWVCCGLLGFGFKYFVDGVTLYGAFFIFCGICGLGQICMYFTVKETKDKTALEIEKLFGNGEEALLEEEKLLSGGTLPTSDILSTNRPKNN